MWLGVEIPMFWFGIVFLLAITPLVLLRDIKTLSKAYLAATLLLFLVYLNILIYFIVLLFKTN